MPQPIRTQERFAPAYLRPEHPRESRIRVKSFEPHQRLETLHFSSERSRPPLRQGVRQQGVRQEWAKDTQRADRSRSPIRRSIERYTSSLNKHGDPRASDDHLLEKLNKLAKLPSNQLRKGEALVQWVHELSYTLRRTQKLSTCKIKEYIGSLTVIKNSISDWNILHAETFYYKLSKVGFFYQISQLDKKTQYEIIQLHNKLIKKLSKDLSKIPLNKDSLSNFASLLKAAADNSEITDNKADLAQFVNTINSCLLNCKGNMKLFQLSFSPQNLFKFHHFEECQATICQVTERCLSEIAALNKDRISNVEFAKLFTHYTKLIDSLARTIKIDKSITEKLKILISKIDFIANSKYSSSGFFSIMTCIENKFFTLEGVIAEKLNECILGVYDNKDSLTTQDSLFNARSFLKYFIEFGEIPSHVKELFDICVANLSSDEAELNFSNIKCLLNMIKDSCDIHLPAVPLYKAIERLMLTHKAKLMRSDPIQIRIFLARFSTMISKLKSNHININIFNLNELLNELIKLYSEKILSSDLNVQLNTFNSLSVIATDCFHADSKVRDLYRDLYSKLKEQIREMDINQVIRFLNHTYKFGNLIKTDKKEMLHFFKYYSQVTIKEKMPTDRKLSLIWSMLVFYTKHNKEFTDSEIILLKNTTKQIYDSILNKENLTTRHIQTLMMAERWLKLPTTKSSEKPLSSISFFQRKANNILRYELDKNKLHSIAIENEYSDQNCLPPCDIALPEQKIVIEIQGMHHYFDEGKKYKTGATLLKTQLYKEAGYHVFEVSVNNIEELEKAFEVCVKEIVQITKKIKFA